VESYLQQILRYGFFHADPHPWVYYLCVFCVCVCSCVWCMHIGIRALSRLLWNPQKVRSEWKVKHFEGSSKHTDLPPKDASLQVSCSIYVSISQIQRLFVWANQTCLHTQNRYTNPHPNTCRGALIICTHGKHTRALRACTHDTHDTHTHTCRGNVAVDKEGKLIYYDFGESVRHS